MIPLAKPYLTKKDARSAYNTILTHWVTQGPKVAEFEKKFAHYVGAKYAVAVSSCTTALHLALIVSGVNAGDEIICPSLSFIATANVIRYVGATPIFSDVDPVSYNIDPNKVKQLITKKTKAIIVVHQLGMPADIDDLKKIAKKYKIKIIEDAACAVGSIYKGKKIGSHSKLVCFSFHPRKVITTGDGGIIATSNRNYYERLKRLRQHAMSISDFKRHSNKRFIQEHFDEVGFNYRMTDIQAAVGIEQLKKIDWIIKKRREVAELYNKSFAPIKHLQIPTEPKQARSNYQTYMLYVKPSSPIPAYHLIRELLKRGIASRNGLMLIHKEPAYAKTYAKIHLVNSEEISKRGVAIPLYIPMRKKDITYIIKTITDLVS